MVEGIQLPSPTIQRELLEELGSASVKDTVTKGRELMIASCNTRNCVDVRNVFFFMKVAKHHEKSLPEGFQTSTGPDLTLNALKLALL